MGKKSAVIVLATTCLMVLALTGTAMASEIETQNFQVGEATDHSTYAFSYQVPGEIIASEDVSIGVTFATDELGDSGYDGVRFAFGATGPGDVTFTATDSADVEHTFTNNGYWGPSGGFDLPADYTSTTDFTLQFSAAGEYMITFSLIDATDGSVVADITDSVTVNVEPVASTYAFSYQVPDEIIAGEDVSIGVTFATDELGDSGYDGVRFAFGATGPGDVTFTATDSADVEHTFTNNGYWGPSGGFDLPADYTSTTDFTLQFSAAGEYMITFSLIDADTGDVVADITDSVTIEVVMAEEPCECERRGFGYWRHERNQKTINDQISINGKEYTLEELRGWLGARGRHEDDILARHFATAVLNLSQLCDNCTMPLPVQEAFDAAHDQLRGNGANGASRSEVLNWKDTLELWNENRL